MTAVVLAVFCLFSSAAAAGGVLSGFDDAIDEILTHENLNSAAGSNGAEVVNVAMPFGDEERMMNLEEQYGDVPHPTLINNWGSDLDEALGQVGGVAITPEDDPIVFHRGCHKWDEK